MTTLKAMSPSRQGQFRLQPVFAFLVVSLTADSTPVFLARAMAQTPATAAPTAAANDADQTEAESIVDAVADPELIALAWQYRAPADGKRIRQPVWRPDGTRLTPAETSAAIQDSAYQRCEASRRSTVTARSRHGSAQSAPEAEVRPENNEKPRR